MKLPTFGFPMSPLSVMKIVRYVHTQPVCTCALCLRDKGKLPVPLREQVKVFS